MPNVLNLLVFYGNYGRSEGRAPGMATAVETFFAGSSEPSESSRPVVKRKCDVDTCYRARKMFIHTYKQACEKCLLDV